MMEGMSSSGHGAMMLGMSFAGLLVIVVVVLGIAALAKYLFFSDQR